MVLLESTKQIPRDAQQLLKRFQEMLNSCSRDYKRLSTDGKQIARDNKKMLKRIQTIFLDLKYLIFSMYV